MFVQLEMEFMRLTNVPVRRSFYAALDTNLEVLVSAFSERGGTAGQLIKTELSRADNAEVCDVNLQLFEWINRIFTNFITAWYMYICTFLSI